MIYDCSMKAYSSVYNNIYRCSPLEIMIIKEVKGLMEESLFEMHKNSHLEGFKCIFHLEHQAEIRSRSCWKELQSETDFTEQYIATSSAKIFIVEQTADGKSLM